MHAREMWSAVEREEPDRAVGPVLDDRADAVGVREADVEGVFDSGGDLDQAEPLQEPQHPDERPRSRLRFIGFHSPAEQCEALWEVPLLQGLRMIEAARLAFQERQVVHGLKKHLLSIPAPIDR